MADHSQASQGASRTPRGGFCILHDPETLPYELCMAEHPSQLLKWVVELLNDADADTDAEQGNDVRERLPILGVPLRPANVILLLITRDPARMVDWANCFVTAAENDRARAAQRANAVIEDRIIEDDAATLIGSESDEYEEEEEEDISGQSYDSENDNSDDSSSHYNHPREPDDRIMPSRSRESREALPLRRQHDGRSCCPRNRNYNDRSRSPLRPDYEYYCYPRT